MRVARGLFVLVGLCGCPMATGIPPTRGEVATMAVGDEQLLGLRVTAGAHLASGLVRDTPLDVGAGYQFELVDGEGADHGGYAEVAVAVLREKWWRTWLGVKGDAMFVGDNRFGSAVKLSWEANTVVRGSGPVTDRCFAGEGAVYGRTAFGLYMEAGVRSSVGDERVSMLLAGLTVRLPAAGVVGLLIPVPGC